MRKKFWPLIPGEDGREDNGKEKGDDSHSDNEQDGVLHGGDKLGVLEQDLKVVQPHKGFGGGVGPPLKERHAEDIDGGHNHKEEKQDDRRGNTQKDKPAAAFAAHEIAPFSLKQRRR